MTTPPNDLLLLLAAAIAEWDSTLSGLDALGKMGHYDETRRPSVRHLIQRELQSLCDQWPRITIPHPSVQQVVAEARAYVTKHQQRLNELLDEEE